MTFSETLPVHREHAESARRMLNEMRRHRRVQLDLSGRFMRANRDEHDCRLLDFSVGGASLKCDVAVASGERIVVYFQHLGGFDAEVVRKTGDGFAIQFNVSDHKREKLAAQMMWLLNKDAFPGEAGRVHERSAAGQKQVTLEVEEGIVLDVKLLDLSISGASVKTAARPAIGSFVMLNNVRSIVRRHHGEGVGLQFLKALTPEALAQSFP